MLATKQVLHTILRQIKPSAQEAKILQNTLKTFAKNIQIPNAKVEIGGSTAKNTWLKGNHDADFFVKFNYATFKDKNEQLSDILHKHLNTKGIHPTRIHGSRDYFQVQKDGYTFEIIPILAINSIKEAKNITDASPLHARWVNKFPTLSDDIRLAKQFAKAQEVYGAESYINGFSGYVLEILVINYKGFLRLLKATTHWKPPVIIDYAKHHKNPLLEINQSKRTGPLIVIDPIEPGRNAAAAISEETFKVFVKSAKRFLAKPTPSYFEIQKKDMDTITNTHKKQTVFFITLTLEPGKRDVVGCRIVHLIHTLVTHLEKHKFLPIAHGFWWKNKQTAIAYIVLNPKKTPPPTTIIKGPPAEMKEHAAAFKKKHPNAKLVKKQWLASSKTLYTKPEILITDLLKKSFTGITSMHLSKRP